MKKASRTFSSTDEYIAQFPDPIQQKLGEMRAIIRAAAPDATETISYAMPAFAQHGTLVYFAAWKDHVGFYHATGGIGQFADELKAYGGTSGSIHFPYDQPLPADLITRIVQFRISENTANAQAKKKPSSA